MIKKFLLRLKARVLHLWNTRSIQTEEVALLNLNTKLECLFCNRGWTSLTGKNFEQETHQGWTKSIHNKDREKVLNNILVSIKDKKNLSHEFRIVNKKRRSIWIKADGKIYYNRKGNVKGVLYEINNIQNEKINQRNFSFKRTQCENRAKNTRNFLLNMSHEIRTPLNAILGFTELLQKDSLDKEEKKEAITSIFYNSQMLAQLTDNFLELSKVEAGKINLHYKIIDMTEFLSHIQSIFKANVERNNLEFKIFKETHIPDKLYFDPTLTKQVLINLIGNSLKFTNKGFIHLNLHWKKETYQNHGILRFSIIDSGCGIPKEHIKKIFKNFSQAPTIGENNYFKGSGLGLALCKRLAKKMNGNVEIKFSNPYKENRFDFQIPIKIIEFEKKAISVLKPFTKPLRLPLNSDSKTLDCPSLLLVEDSIENQKLFKVILSKIGVKIDTASNGKLAMKKVLEKNYDIILMDIELPDIRGTKVTRWFREKNYTKPIIALTAHAIQETKDHIMSFGFNNYLTKPIHPQELIRVLQSYISPKVSASEMFPPPSKTLENVSLPN